MYTSDINAGRNSAARTAFIYLLISVFCILFGAVYEFFSHEVYSFFMIYAFVFPLVGGTLPFLSLSVIKPERYPTAVSRNLYNAGISTLTVGSLIKGVLEIYGTTNSLANIYWYTGIPLILIGLSLYFVSMK